MEEVLIKKMIKGINSGDYASAREHLKDLMETKIQQRIKDSMRDEKSI
jgi:hypothetical protein